jgi:peptidoglycan/LPS O-acetylase OafA/YrhL
MESPGRIISLDLLRGAAAYAVAIPHFFLYRGATDLSLEVASIIAVELFFVLSGFVLAPQIMLFLSSGDPRVLGVFYLRRWMRTLPPYFISLVAISIMAQKLFSLDFAKYAFFVQNVAGPSVISDYFPIAWSLSVEEWYYVAFPLVCIALTRIGRLSPVGCAVVFIAVISILRIAATTEADDWGEHIRRATLFRVDSIAYGFLLYHYRDRAAALGSRVIFLVYLCAGGALVLTTVSIAGHAAWPAKIMFPFLAALWSSSTIALLLALGPAIEKVPCISWTALWAGRLSYSTYLFHAPILMLLGGISFEVGNSILFLGYLISTLGVILAMYVYVERPILDARPTYHIRGRAPAAAPTQT